MKNKEIRELVLLKELSDKILESSSYKFFLRFLPSFKRRIKQINILSAEIIAKYQNNDSLKSSKKHKIEAAAILKPELYSGERQVYDSIDDVRKDHVGRYQFSTKYITKNDLVLDAACGIGYGSFLINKEVGAEVLGVDISHESVEYANEHYRQNDRVNFIVSDILKLELPAQHFDVVTSFETIEHVREDREILQKFHQLLKPSGLFICSTPNENKMRFADGKWPFHIRHYTPDELIDLVTSNGFEILEMHSQYDKHSAEIHLGKDGLFNIVVCKKIRNVLVIGY